MLHYTKYSISIFIVFSIILIYSSSTFAGELFDRIIIKPQNVGLLYNATNNPEKTQQFQAFGVKNGVVVANITYLVDWYIDPNGYPVQDQPVDHVTAEINIDTGVATAVSNWGRVIVHACYPKGCAPSSAGNPAPPFLTPLLMKQ